ncbi:MAG: HAD-IIIA family hydrolase [Fulvivirga sp.]
MDKILTNFSKKQLAKARKVKALIFDVDGVLTDGRITYTENGDELKSFNVKDGQIIRFLKENGIIVGAITGRESEIVSRRSKELKLDFYYQGAESKQEKYEQIKKDYCLSDNDVAYIGDDIIDMYILKHAGFSAAPHDALTYVKDQVDFVSTKNGGEGVLREVADMILASKGKLEQVLNYYLD